MKYDLIFNYLIIGLLVIIIQLKILKLFFLIFNDLISVFILIGVDVINWVVSIDLYKFEIIQALFEVFMYIY